MSSQDAKQQALNCIDSLISKFPGQKLLLLEVKKRLTECPTNELSSFELPDELYAADLPEETTDDLPRILEIYNAAIPSRCATVDL